MRMLPPAPAVPASGDDRKDRPAPLTADAGLPVAESGVAETGVAEEVEARTPKGVPESAGGPPPTPAGRGVPPAPSDRRAKRLPIAAARPMVETTVTLPGEAGGGTPEATCVRPLPLLEARRMGCQPPAAPGACCAACPLACAEAGPGEPAAQPEWLPEK